ncbi:hypothetical protein [Roseibium salinum]|uniref:Uncharacterized protein n=1 Tax=Roseibium salinum TaxID=1604349 RepID=A0ABT3QWX2_9HYPH|nr:hypothetical protein [Roseibium sp. DSM 29163]MCX2721343.1 hypothetical protein [Roseibium sp. DSM 29163]MDN3722225.1 hypothetical protein [Roseibium salinum]
MPEFRVFTVALALIAAGWTVPGLAGPNRFAELPLPQQSLIVPVLDKRITRTRDLPTWELQRARKRMLAGQRISYDQMRALADHGDGLAAFRYANRLVELGDPDVLSAAALYYASAAYTGRDYAVGPLLKILERRDVEFSERRLTHLENSLRALAMSGDRDAADGLLKLYSTGHPFGFQPDRVRQFRVDLAAAGDPNAAMQLALNALSGNAGEEVDKARVAALLATVMEADDLGLRTAASNLQRMLDQRPGLFALGEAVEPTEEEKNAIAEATNQQTEAEQ